MKANIRAQFLSKQNFEIPFYSFLMSTLADMMLKKVISMTVNSAFLNSEIKYKKSVRQNFTLT